MVRRELTRADAVRRGGLTVNTATAEEELNVPRRITESFESTTVDASRKEERECKEETSTTSSAEFVTSSFISFSSALLISSG